MSNRNKPLLQVAMLSAPNAGEEPQPTAEASRVGDRRFEAFMDNVPGFAWMKDIDGRYVYANRRLAELCPGDWLGKSDADFWPAEIAASYQANDQRVMASRQSLETVEPYQLNGETRHMLVTKFPIFDSDGARTEITLGPRWKFRGDDFYAEKIRRPPRRLTVIAA